MGKTRNTGKLATQIQFDNSNNLVIGNSTSSSFNTSGSVNAIGGITGSIFGIGDPTSFSASISSNLVSIQSITASNIARLSNLETKSSSVDISVSSINIVTASLNSKTGSYATTGSNTFVGTQIVSASMYVQGDFVVYGSSSIQYISASSVSIGTNIVQLNTANPAVRYAGLSVQDSGSAQGVTGSMLWDSVCNRWIYSNPSGVGYSGGVIMSGPRAATFGTETTLTCNYIAKSGGGDHLYDSIIQDTSTYIDVAGYSYFRRAGKYIIINPNVGAACTYADIGTDTGMGLSFSPGGGGACMYLSCIGNLGIGSDSPSDKLHILGVDSGITICSATANRPVLKFINGSCTMLKLSVNGTYGAISDNTGNDSMFFKNGNVGIGVTPSAGWTSGIGLEVGFVGSAIWGRYANEAHFTNNFYYSTSAGCRVYASTNPASDYEQYNGNHNWYTAPSGTAGQGVSLTSRMTILQAGNVGVGTTTPAYKFVVSNSGAQGMEVDPVTPSIAGGVDLLFYNRSTAAYKAASFLACQFYFTGGNVAMGITTPSTNLHICGAGAVFGGYGYPQVLIEGGSYPGLVLKANTNGIIMRMDAAGSFNLALGPTDGNFCAGFTVTTAQNAIYYGNIFLNQTSVATINANATSIGINGIYYMNRGSGNALSHIIFGNGGNVIGGITSCTTATQFNTTSDYRLKTDFKTYDGICLINQIKTYDFAWKLNDARTYGVIAHELSDIIPYAVTGEKDGLDERNCILPQSVDYSKIVTPLIKAVQEQQCIICSQSQKIALLESCIGII